MNVPLPELPTERFARTRRESEMQAEYPEPCVESDWRWALIPTFFASGAVSLYCLYVSARLISSLFSFN